MYYSFTKHVCIPFFPLLDQGLGEFTSATIQVQLTNNPVKTMKVMTYSEMKLPRSGGKEARRERVGRE